MNKIVKEKMKGLFWYCKTRMMVTPEKDTRTWRYLIATLCFASTLAAFVTALGNPIGFNRLMELILVVIVNVLLFSLLSLAIGFLLSLVKIPIPRLFFGSLSYSVILVFIILNTESSGILFSIIIAIIFPLLAIIFGLMISIAFNKRVSFRSKIAFVFAPISMIITAIIWLAVTDDLKNGYLETVEVDYIENLVVKNPAEPGPYSYQYFTYGSGEDKHRIAFAENVDVISDSVDASHFITSWRDRRTQFWGFDQTALPLNGRVWMPLGEGPFPLVLMVHGNHIMEYFSDEGYAYLGELLASHGYIAISVDQNFINYSNWSGSPNQNYQLRSWTFLQHLFQLEDFHHSSSSPFFGQVDLNQVALIGHSRGGQAAAMATDYHTFFPDEDIILDRMENITIQAVIGIAPTDRSIDQKRPQLSEVNYLVMHGARDADLVNFRGDRQFARTHIEPNSDRFKASLYIADANHSQFNSDWGRMDSSLSRGLFLNQRQIMNGEYQREIAKVYISSFLATVFNDTDDYIDLFRDFRHGQEWLPDTQYLSKFQNGTYIPLTEFDSNRDKQDFLYDVTVEAEGFTNWEVITPRDRIGNQRVNDAVLLEWDRDSPASYSTFMSDSFRDQMLSIKPENLVITLANMELENDVLDDSGDSLVPSKIEVELVTTDGLSVQLPLDHFMRLPPVITTEYTTFGLFDNIFREGKYDTASEAVFQMMKLPLNLFAEADPNFNVVDDEIRSMTLHFQGDSGKIAIESIGFSQ